VESYRPTLQNLYASSAFEQRADLIMFLFRQAYYDPHLPDNEIEIGVAKQRGGRTGWLTFKFDKDTLRIY